MCAGFSENHHDFVPAKDVRLEAAVSSGLLEKKYECDLKQFRGDIARKLHEYGALDTGEGWAIFYRQGVEDMDNPDVFRTSQKITLIMLFRARPSQGFPAPTVRIITNERIESYCGEQILTQDLMADGVDRIQYRVGAYDPGSQEVADTTASLFGVNDAGLYLANTEQFTPEHCKSASPETGQEESAVPFGSYMHMEHKIHALSVAYQLFDEVAGLKPSCTSSSE